jgi:nicotinate-nucleotide pyrophosphorylase (carboxylating)
MPLDLVCQAVQLIHKSNPQVKIEASGNITLETIRAIAKTGVYDISSSAPGTRSTWLDLSMNLDNSSIERPSESADGSAELKKY